ncbi:phage tail tape measure protein [Aeromonas veronii]|uniref:phage tail tape measure protein n=1 Tax=Aeromonas veronii TaxID=654 RepID=UPI0023640C24|nr:phage tail tape measure protein [Aeromonas veronii]MDD1846574.1 phage tail tape measure protein [Aeromonas veronii]
MEKKYSVVLSAKEQMSSAFDSAGEASKRLRGEVDLTQKELKQLGDTAARAGDYEKLNRAFGETKAQLAGTRREAAAAATDLAKLTAAQEEYKRELQQAERQLAKMRGFVGPVTPQQQEAISAATRKVDELKQAYTATGQAIKATERQQRTAAGESRKLNDQLSGQGRRLGSLASDLQKAGVSTKALGAEQLRLKRETEAATSSLDRQQKRLKTIGDAQSKMQANSATRGELAGQTLGLLATVAPAGYAMKKAIDYESAFAGVTKVVNFSSPQEEAETRARMMKLASEYGVSQTGMTGIVAAAGEAGIGRRKDGSTDKEELLRFAGDASRMSVAMDITAEEAGTTIAKWRSAMNMNQDQAMRLADYANAVSNEMAAKPAEVARVMLRQGATTMKAGFTDRQAAALAATLIAGGEGEETTATAMKNITGRLGKSFAATKAQKDTLAMLGFNPEVLAKDMQRDAGGTLFKVLGKIGQQDVDKQAAVISQLFGEEVVGAVSKLTTNTELLKKAMRLAGDEAAYAGSMQSEYQNKANTRQAMIDRNAATMERATIAVGDLLLPIVDEVVPPLTNLAASGAELLQTSEAARETVGWMIKAGAVVVGLKAVHIVAKGIGTMLSDAWQMGRIMKAKLGGSSDQTASSANRAAAGLARVNRQLDRMGGASGPAGSPAGRGRAGRRPSRLGKLREAEERIAVAGRRKGRWGKFGKGAGLLGVGAGLMMMPKGAEASEMVGDVAELGGDAASVLSSAGKSVGHVAGKVIRPLGVISAGSELYGAAMTGNASAVGGAAGNIAGGAGGAWAGAAAGAAVGSIVPVVGTAVGAAVGGALGGWAGSELGEVIGTKVGGYFKELKDWWAEDKIKAPAGDALTKQIVQNSTKKETNVKNDIRIEVKASGDPEQDNALAKKIEAKLQALLGGSMMTGFSLNTRVDGSLMGLGSD